MDSHHLDDALRAANADACPCGEPGDRKGATARKGGPQMECLSRDLRGEGAPRGLSERSLSVLNALADLSSRRRR